MATGQAVQTRCGARTKRGGICGQRPGWGTPHPGRGPCKVHGGCLPKVIAKYAQEEAIDQARAWGIEADIDPLNAIVEMVRLSVGATRELRRRAAANPDLGPDSPEVMAFMASTKHTAQVAKLAIDAGVAEREIRLVERMADMISAAFEDALGPAGLAEAERQAIAERFSGGLARLEQGDTIEGRES